LRFSRDLTSKKIVEIVIVIVLFGIGLLVYDFVTTQIHFNNEISRNKAGSGDNREQFIIGFLDNEEEIEVEISEQHLSEREMEDIFEKAISEIEETYLGRNKTPENVQYDIVTKTSYVGGVVKANWQFDEYMLISSDGKIRQDKISDQGNIVNAKVLLNYLENERCYCFSFVIKPFDLSSIEGQRKAIKDEIESADEKTINSPVMLLPTNAQGMELRWKKKMDLRGFQLIVLAVITGVALIVGKKQEAKKIEKSRDEQLEKDYPMIVSKLSILMSAGMSFRGALERICLGIKKETPTAGYEELLRTYRQINDGIGEIEAIENFGIRTGRKEYRRLCMLLCQNIKKGSRELIDSLEKEELSAFESRKQRAMKAGEEASTKLLLPMSGMLFVVIVILIVPALMQMKM